MALSLALVEQNTQGRLDQQDAETARLLAAALALCRRYCGWPVTPIQVDDVVKFDGGVRSIRLPTMALVSLTSVVENGVTLDLADVVESADAPARLYKKSGALWCKGFSAIEVTMTHGYAAADDFEAAVLFEVDRMSLSVGGARSVVGPFQYAEPSDYAKNILDSYRLERSP